MCIAAGFFAPVCIVFLVVALGTLVGSSARTTRKIGNLHCHSYPEQRNMTCCLMNGQVRCLPYFIIAGTQKSGTTVLSAYLSEHPHIRFHSRKEAHYFDRQKEYSKGVVEYLRGFHPWDPAMVNNSITSSRNSHNRVNNSNGLANWRPPLYGESTPFYIASPVACSRIAQLLPQVKMVVLLREPVARAYSEYQMKKRRVDSQNGFIHLMQLHAVNVSRCMLRVNGDLVALKACVPYAISSHAHWNRFVMSQNTRLDEGDSVMALGSGRGKMAVSKYKGRTKKRIFLEAQARLKVGSSMVSRCYSFAPEPPEDSSTGGNVGREKRRRLLQGYSNISITADLDDGLSVRAGYTVGKSQSKDTSRSRSTRRRLSSSESTGSSRSSRTSSTESLYFQPRACMGKYASEILLPLREAFLGEAQALRECAGPTFGSSVQELEKAVRLCVEVKTGITRQFVYRSIFAAQLHRCFKSQFLILPSERLQTEPEDTMRRVYEFLGLLPDTTLSSAGFTDSLNAHSALLTHAHEFLRNTSHVAMAVNKFFPRFEVNTGWRASSEYEPMPAELREEMRSFFAPLNELLFRLLDTEPFPEWSLVVG